MMLIEVDLEVIVHLVEGDVGLVGGVNGRHWHLRPGGWVCQGDVVRAVGHEHPAVGHILSREIMK